MGIIIGDADIVHLVNEPRLAHLIVHSALDAVSGIGLTHHFPCCLQLIHRTLIHGYTGTGEPSLGLQMCCKVLQEGKNQLAILGLLGFALHCLGAVGGTIIVIKDIMPGNEGIAIYLLIDAAIHHELHPLVEYGVIILP